MNILSIYPSHDASVSVMTDKGYRVFELERLLKDRFASLLSYDGYEEVYNELKKIIIKECGVDSFDICYYLHLNEAHKNCLTNIFKINEFQEVYHHESHAACSFYQSSFDEALVVSCDGGGYDGYDDNMGFFNIYLAKRNEPLKRLKRINIDMGTSYGLMGVNISEIYKSSKTLGRSFLTFAGKLMGLAAYGKVRTDWVKPIEQYYKNTKNIMDPKCASFLGSYINERTSFNCFSGQESYDLAATSQFVFEKIFIEETSECFDEYEELPVCLSGGCALNVILNQKLKNSFKDRELFIPPNPNDCGLSFGMIALKQRPQEAVNLTYSGMPILDIDELSDYVSKYNAKQINVTDLAKLLYEGKIIGFMQGNSEHGPRALGNRSILCNPGFAHMKDTLNAKIKFREWFRPFAPVVRQHNVGRYFDFTGEAPYMSFSPKVKDNWLDKLPAIVHQDNTARVQTITEQQNKFLYDLLGEFEALSGYDVLLNTSFNIKGKPILTTIEDAINVLETTEISAVIINGYFFEALTR